jgi:hypothetical protein
VAHLATPLTLSATSSGLVCAGLAGGIVGGAAICVMILDLLRAPEGYEDESGFHVVGKDASEQKGKAPK